MRHIRIRLISISLTIVMISALLCTPARGAFETKAQFKSAVLLDVETSQLLFEQNPHEPVIPASLVKMMVLLLVLERIEAGTIHLSDPVTASAWASKIGGQQIYLAQGETFPLEDLLKAIAISSANDAATAVAEFVAGHTDGFVQLMNARAQELGMHETTFANVHGLPPDPGQKENTTSAYDIAILGRELLKHPQVLSWTSTVETGFRNGTFTLTSTNRELLLNYPGADGLKTGYHPRGADFCGCATAQRQERRLLAVVMGAPDKGDRYRATVDLLNFGFTQFERVVVFRKGLPVGDPIKVVGGKARDAYLTPSDNAVVVVEKGKQAEIHHRVNLPAQQMTAPVAANTPFGDITILIGETPARTVPLVVAEDVRKGSFIDRMKWWILGKFS
jgi:serine-type D-Ala-D-Ala carboxypeptidase (penicillin-binding protein 5/6)